MLLATVSVLNMSDSLAALPNKSGVSPESISLPSGPGSIEGLGESFEPVLSSGAAKYSVPLVLPPGRAGFSPSLSLQYDGGTENKMLGIGWSMPTLSIRRQSDKGLPSYSSADPDVFITETGAELVPVEGGAGSDIQVYRQKIEGLFSRYVYYRLEDRWEITTRSGVRFSLGSRLDGTEVNARVKQPDNGSTYAWHVAEALDTNGNEIIYSYTSEQQQVYCASIQYGFLESGGPSHQVLFEYADRPDPVVDYRSGFRLVTAKRLVSIAVESGGSLVRRYVLDYAVDSSLSLLESVIFVGSDGSSTLPPARFSYTKEFVVSDAKYTCHYGSQQRKNFAQ